ARRMMIKILLALHTERQCWTRRIAARGGFAFGGPANPDRAARASHRDELLTSTAQKLAFGVARRLGECVQAGGSCRSGRTFGTPVVPPDRHRRRLPPGRAGRQHPAAPGGPFSPCGPAGPCGPA